MADRQEAYLALVRDLLECEGGTEKDILEAHPELVDKGLMMTLLSVIQAMAAENDPEHTSTIEWLSDFATQLDQTLGLEIASNSGDLESQLKFLMTVFKAIAENNGNTQIIYPLFRDNLGHLNESLIPLLTTWHQTKFAEVDEDDKQLLAAVVNNFANLIQQFSLGSRLIKLEIAIECYQLALSVYTHNTYPEDWAMTQNNLAAAYSTRIRGERAANLELSIKSYHLALSVYTHDIYPEKWAMTQNNLAGAYSDRIWGERTANLESAIESYQQALSVCTRDAYPEHWSVAYKNRFLDKQAAKLEDLAVGYSNLIRGERTANLESAIECYRFALFIRTQDAYPEKSAIIQNNLAFAYSNRIRGKRAANLESAIAGYQLVLCVRTLEAYPEKWAETQNNLAILYAKSGKNELAVECYQQALAIFTPATFPINALKANRGLGRIYFTQGEWQLAVDAYAMAIEAAETSRNWATDEDERQRIIREAISVYEYTIQAYINLGRIDLAITTSERARSRQLVDFMRVADLYIDGEIPAEVRAYFDEYEALERQIQAQQIHPTTDNPENSNRQLAPTRDSRALEVITAKVKELEAQKQAVWRKIRALDPELAAKRQITPIDLPTIQGLITTPNTAILSFYTTDDDTHIFIITPDRAPQIHTCKGQGLEQFQVWLGESWLDPYLNNKSNWSAQIPTILSEVAQRLELDTLVSKLDGITDLVIIPHLFLHQIPFAALPTGAGGELLSNKFTISYTPSCQILQDCNNRSPIDRTQHGTIENADGTLPGAEYEGAFVANLFKLPDRYRRQGRSQATIAGFQSLMATTDRPVTNLHFANHANSRLDAPLESALQLSDGNLGLDRLMISRYPHLHEVFLSCCETHLGATKITDDILTIGTGFLCAGARSVISTLWSVNDLATALFSIFYYQNRYANHSRAKSLKMAQVRLRNLPGEEFKLNYRDDLDRHLQAYAKANITDRKELEAQFDRGEIDAGKRDRDCDRLTKAYYDALDMIDLLDRHCEKDKPFTDPYYWAGFICQGLA